MAKQLLASQYGERFKEHVMKGDRWTTAR